MSKISDDEKNGVGVKPLEWLSDKLPYTAYTPFCYYRIEAVDDDTGPHWQTTIRYQGSTYQRHESEEEAKVAAKDDYERRILSALQGEITSEKDKELIYRVAKALAEHGYSQVPFWTWDDMPEESTVMTSKADYMEIAEKVCYPPPKPT